MKKQLLGLLLLVACIGGASAAQPAAASCDRECLRSHITQILWSLVKHDVSKLPVAATLRVTEDAVEKPLKDVALIRSVTALQGYRQDFIDERMGMAGAHVMVEESGAPSCWWCASRSWVTSSPNWNWYPRAAAPRASSSTSTA
ncbi:MAG: hypothetical protein IPG49_12640 [Proteobacteria bacterium]|nr:hypothetical protein [Pseudomonadota bacterium]